MNLGGPELLIIVIALAFALIPIALGIMVAVDASKYPDVAAILWYSSYKPKIAAAAGGASPY